MILCEVNLFELNRKEIVKIDDAGKGWEILNEFKEMFGGGEGFLVCKELNGVVNPQHSLYQQGVKNGYSIIYVMNIEA